jgi:hypothetical protein
MTDNAQITKILHEVANGNRTRINELIPVVYDELRHIAAKQMYGENRLSTITPTAFAHEAYLKLVNQQDFQWNDVVIFLLSLHNSCAGLLLIMRVPESLRNETAKKSHGLSTQLETH